MKIFFDIDETLIHTYFEPNVDIFGTPDFVFTLDDGMYCTNIRPSSRELIDFARDIVGFENVCLLTASLKEYSNEINKLAEWEFSEKNIIAREDTKKIKWNNPENKWITFYKEFCGVDHILIDNLPHHENWLKNRFTGIGGDFKRYLHIEDYFGVNNKEEEFEKQVKEFIIERTKHLK